MVHFVEMCGFFLALVYTVHVSARKLENAQASVLEVERDSVNANDDSSGISATQASRQLGITCVNAVSSFCRQFQDPRHPYSNGRPPPLPLVHLYWNEQTHSQTMITPLFIVISFQHQLKWQH